MVNGQGFSLKQKRSSLKFFFGLKLGAIIVLLVIIFSILNYLDVLPLANFSPKFPSLQQSKVSNSTPSVLTPKVFVESARKDYVLSQNIEETSRYFEKQKFWNKAYNTKVQKDTKPLSNLAIFLSDNKNQIADIKGNDGNIAFSYSMVFKEDGATVRIYLPDAVLQDARASQVFGNAVGHIVSVLDGTSRAQDVMVENSETRNLFNIKKNEQIPTTTPSVNQQSTTNSIAQ